MRSRELILAFVETLSSGDPDDSTGEDEIAFQWHYWARL
jgi:hypothetical protein